MAAPALRIIGDSLAYAIARADEVQELDDARNDIIDDDEREAAIAEIRSTIPPRLTRDEVIASAHAKAAELADAPELAPTTASANYQYRFQDVVRQLTPWSTFFDQPPPTSESFNTDRQIVTAEMFLGWWCPRADGTRKETLPMSHCTSAILNAFAQADGWWWEPKAFTTHTGGFNPEVARYIASRMPQPRRPYLEAALKAGGYFLDHHVGAWLRGYLGPHHTFQQSGMTDDWTQRNARDPVALVAQFYGATIPGDTFYPPARELLIPGTTAAMPVRPSKRARK